MTVAESPICRRCGHDPACGFASMSDDREVWRLCHCDDHSCYEQEILDRHHARRATAQTDGSDERPVWERCGCDQWGRCLVNCSTAHLPKWATPMGRKLGLRRPEGA